MITFLIEAQEKTTSVAFNNNNINNKLNLLIQATKKSFLSQKMFETQKNFKVMNSFIQSNVVF